jgi:hypothetical protein
LYRQSTKIEQTVERLPAEKNAMRENMNLNQEKTDGKENETKADREQTRDEMKTSHEEIKFQVASFASWIDVNQAELEPE